MLNINNLTKKFNENVVLSKVSISISSPGIYVICGESGCGKTTLINILGLMDEEYEGDYYFINQNVKNMTNQEKELIRYNQISYIYQNPKFLENESIKVNLEIALNKKYRKKELIENLKKVNLNINYNKKVSFLSGGERKRLAILISILKDTPLILADEITVGLDNENKINIMNYLLELSKTKIILLLTHDISFIKHYVKNVYYIKNKQIFIKTKDEIVYENETRKDNKLQKTFIRKHIINHIKSKTLRTLLSTLCMVIALVSFGFSILLTSSLSDSITDSLSKNINDQQILVTKKEEMKRMNKNVTLDKYEIKEIQREYNHYFDYSGVNYLNNLSTFFKDEDYLEVIIDHKRYNLKGYCANSINNFTYIELDDEPFIYSSKKMLEEDEIILSLTNNQVYTFCNLLNIEYKDETSLLSYLINFPLNLSFYFSNSDWEYEIKVNLKMIGYTISDEKNIYHTDSLWNEYFLEEVLQLIYSYELDVIDEIPWTMKKIHYLKLKEGKEMMFLQEFLSNINMESYAYGILRREDAFLVYFIKKYDNNFTKSSLDNLLNENLVNYQPCSTNGYNVIENALLKGFVKPTYICNEYKLIEEYIDYNSYSASNLGNYQSTILTYTNEQLLSLNLLDSSNSNFITVKTYNNEGNEIVGRYPKKYNEIIVSRGLLNSLNISLNNRVFSEKQVYFLTLKDIEYANGKYKNNYIIEKLIICGVIEEDEKIVYVPSYWSSIYLTLILEDNYINYPITSSLYDYKGDDIETYIDELNQKYPKYNFSNPLLDYKKKVDETLYYLNLGLNIFSFFCLTSSLLMIFISSYLFVNDTKKEIGIYTFYGYQRKSIEKQYRAFGNYLSAYSALLSSICLIFLMILLNEGILGITLPFSLESTFPIVLINVIALIIGEISSNYSTKKILKESPLKQLQEN